MANRLPNARAVKRHYDRRGCADLGYQQGQQTQTSEGKMQTGYLTSRHVQARYGVSEMTLWRWQNDPKLHFPKPMIINGRKYYAEPDLVEWERRQAGRVRS